MAGKTTNLASTLRPRCQATTHAAGRPLVVGEVLAFTTRCASVRYVRNVVFILSVKTFFLFCALNS